MQDWHVLHSFSMCKKLDRVHLGKKPTQMVMPCTKAWKFACRMAEPTFIPWLKNFKYSKKFEQYNYGHSMKGRSGPSLHAALIAERVKAEFPVASATFSGGTTHRQRLSLRTAYGVEAFIARQNGLHSRLNPRTWKLILLQLTGKMTLDSPKTLSH